MLNTYKLYYKIKMTISLPNISLACQVLIKCHDLRGCSCGSCNFWQLLNHRNCCDNLKNHETNLSHYITYLLWSRLSSRYTCTWELCDDRPFPNSFQPLSRTESWCPSFHMKMRFHSHANLTHFHMNRWVPRLALRERLNGIWKWPILYTELYGNLWNCGLCLKGAKACTHSIVYTSFWDNPH